MEENDFLNRMENLKKPEVNAETSRRQIKFVLLSARKSATWGIWFLIVPIFFFCCVAVKYLLHWNWSIAGRFLDWMADLDKSMSFPAVSILLFIVLPAVGAVMNLLAIMHFWYEKDANELVVTVKVRWVNITLAMICVAVIGIVLLYAISENAGERAARKYDMEWRGR